MSLPSGRLARRGRWVRSGFDAFRDDIGVEQDHSKRPSEVCHSNFRGSAGRCPGPPRGFLERLEVGIGQPHLPNSLRTGQCRARGPREAPQLQDGTDFRFGAAVVLRRAGFRARCAAWKRLRMVTAATIASPGVSAMISIWTIRYHRSRRSRCLRHDRAEDRQRGVPRAGHAPSRRDRLGAGRGPCR